MQVGVCGLAPSFRLSPSILGSTNILFDQPWRCHSGEWEIPGHWLHEKVCSRLTVHCPLAGLAHADFNWNWYVHKSVQELLHSYFVQLSFDAAVNAGRDTKKAMTLRPMVMQSINHFLGEYF